MRDSLRVRLVLWYGLVLTLVVLSYGGAVVYQSWRSMMAEVDVSRYVEFRQTYFQVSERIDIVNHLQGTTATVCGPMAALIGGAS